MKIFLIIKLFLLFSFIAQAQPIIQMDLTATMKSSVLHSYTRRGKVLRCGRITGKTHGPFAYNHEASAKIALTTSDSHSNTTSISLDIASGNQSPSEGQTWRTIRNIKSNVEVIEDIDNITSHEVIISLKDDRPYDKNGGKETMNTTSTCTFNNWSAHYHSPLVTGKIKVGYKMPENTWLVKVTRVQAENALNLSHIDNSEHNGMRGSLNAPMDKGLINNNYYVWAKPGSVIYQEFEYSNDKGNSDTPLNGEMRFNFEPLQAEEIDVVDWITSIDFDPVKLYSDSSSPSDLNAEMEKLLFAFQQPGEIRKIVDKLSATQVVRVLDKLSWIIGANVDNDSWINLKIAASILAHKIGTEYLGDLLPFCEMTKVELPYNNRELRTSWLAVANFLISKTHVRLREYSINDINSLINVLSDYQKQGLTYSAVRNDRESYLKIIKAYQVLKEVMDFRASPLAHSYREIQYIVSEQGSLGTGEDIAQEILFSLSSLADLEQNFNRDVLNRVRQFQPHNDELINIDDLKERAEAIEINIGDVIDMMSRGSQLLSVSNTGLEEMLNIIIRIGSDHVSVFAEEGEGDYEYFRNAYFDQEKIEEMRNSVHSCMVKED